ncbi:ABC transporter permease [Lactiplantibacillus pingfangensis]|uniref:ABC transporter permease n=1 Tax=Lactiplantibacillus pingfangensis TaxID=2559915 RepID=UPI00148596B9|nr:ABC transporter permease [Lactiplantibacillus pingfangensis]
MLNLTRQESYKLVKKRSTLIFIIILVIQNLAFTVLSLKIAKFFPARFLFAGNFGTISTIQLITIATAASIVSSEFDYQTLKSLIPRTSSRQVILISKWLTILGYTLSLLLLTSLITLLAQLFFFQDIFSLTDTIPELGIPIWQWWLTNIFGNFVNLWLLLSLVFLLAALFKKNSVAITVGIVVYFALPVVGTLMGLLIHKWSVLKWNPLNFLNYPLQLNSPELMAKITNLSTTQLLIGNLGYTILFLSIGLFFFARKEA